MLRLIGILVVSMVTSGPLSAQMHQHGADGTGHDMHNMPGLRGENATPRESEELAILFRHFRSMSREVENLPDGIRTVTRSSNPEVMEVLVSHVIGMIDRVDEGDDPKIFIQSPTLAIFFERHDAILTDIDVTETEIIVTQTSDDPDMVEALQVHAAEVSAMVEQGMHAVHMMMMQRAGN